MILPFYIIYAKETFSIALVSTYLLSIIIGSIISNFMWGWIAKKYNSGCVIRVCILMGGLLPILALLITPLGPEVFSIVFFIVGFLKSDRDIGSDPYLLNLSPDEKRTTYLGVRGSLNLLTIILPVIGGIFIETLGYTFTFLLVSVVMIVDFFLMNS